MSRCYLKIKLFAASVTILFKVQTVKVVHGVVVNDRIDETIEFVDSSERVEKPKEFFWII